MNLLPCGNEETSGLDTFVENKVEIKSKVKELL